MLEVADKLSEEFPFVRIDLYSLHNKIYVGEVSCCPDGGFSPFEKEVDNYLGDLLDLNKIDPKTLGHWEKGFKFVYDKIPKVSK